MYTIHLKPRREASLLRRHPWVFSGAIARMDGTPSSGATVRVLDSHGQFLGIGGFSPESQIRVRIYSFEPTNIDDDFFRRALKKAVAKRQSLLADPQRSACRLVYGESDGLPGLIVDRYNDFLVCQFTFAGMEYHKSQLVKLLVEIIGPQGIYERSDAGVRNKEGLPPSSGLLWGQLPPDEIDITEYGLRMLVDVMHGQKTGFYLDQALNRQRVSVHCKELSVLNCFAYTGGFSVAALAGGAGEVCSIDSSQSALQLTGRNVELNGFEASRHTMIDANVFNLLRDFQRRQHSFDMVILDPPKLAENKSQLMKASRAYKDLALQAVKLLVPGGLLVSFSCSGAIDLNLFQKITAGALLDARRQGEVLQYLHQTEDHPVSLEFPESQYLKGLVCRIND